MALEIPVKLEGQRFLNKETIYSFIICLYSGSIYFKTENMNNDMLSNPCIRSECGESMGKVSTRHIAKTKIQKN
jgi:hypothetical protein